MSSKHEFKAQGIDPEGKGVYTLAELHGMLGRLLEMGVPGDTVPKADFTFSSEIRGLKVKTETPLKPF